MPSPSLLILWFDYLRRKQSLYNLHNWSRSSLPALVDVGNSGFTTTLSASANQSEWRRVALSDCLLDSNYGGGSKVWVLAHVLWQDIEIQHGPRLNALLLLDLNTLPHPGILVVKNMAVINAASSMTGEVD